MSGLQSHSSSPSPSFAPSGQAPCDAVPERVRVVVPPPPYVPSLQAIPSTVTTPTVSAPGFPGSRRDSFTHANVSATSANAAASGPILTASSSFVSAAGIYVTHTAAADVEAVDGDADGMVPPPLAEGAAAVRAVDRRPAMIGYFGYMFGGAAINAFLGVILYEEKGFSRTVVGILVSVSPVFQIVLLPALSFVADKYNCANAMLCVCAVGSTLMVYGFTAATNTVLVLAAFLLLVAFQALMNPLLDKHTLLMFPSKGRTAAWGYVRSYGAYGWGIGNPIGGALVEWTGTWTVAAVQYSIGQAALLYCMFRTKPYEHVDHATSSSVNFRDVLGILVENKRLLLFLLASCMMGMGYSFINNFLFIFIRELGGNRFLMGLTLFITVSTEIPIFQCSDRLHALLTERQMISLAMLIWTVRVLGYSSLYIPWLVLLLEPLHGVTFALMWLPGVKLISEIFPAELSSSATGVLFTFVSGFGAIIGNVVAGFLYDSVGARWMFRIAATAMLTAGVAYQLVDRYLERAGHPLGKPHESEKGAGGATAGAAPAAADSVFMEAAVDDAEGSTVTATGRSNQALFLTYAEPEKGMRMLSEGHRRSSIPTGTAHMHKGGGEEELPL